MAKRATAEEIAAFTVGKSVAETKARFGITRSRVYKVRQKFGLLSDEPRKKRQAVADALLEIYNGTMGDHEAANHYGVCVRNLRTRKIDYVPPEELERRKNKNPVLPLSVLVAGGMMK